MTSTIPTLSTADVAARVAAQGPVRTKAAPRPQRTVLERFPAGNPRGSWPAEEFAQQQRRQGVAAEVVMDLPSDSYLVVVEAA